MKALKTEFIDADGHRHPIIINTDHIVYAYPNSSGERCCIVLAGSMLTLALRFETLVEYWSLTYAHLP